MSNRLNINKIKYIKYGNKNILKKFKQLLKNSNKIIINKNNLYFNDNIIYKNKVYKYFILNKNIIIINKKNNIKLNKSKKINNYYNKIIYNFDNINRNSKYDLYIINLKNRKDNKDLIINDIQYNNFNLKFFNAIQNDKGYIGCAISHLSLIRYAKQNKLPYIIVIEDDNIFKENINIISILDNILSNKDWEIFNGSPNIISDNIKFNNNIYLIKGAYSTNFMIYRKSSYKKILDKSYYKLNKPIDVYISEKFIEATILYNNEFICKQKPQFSNIENKIVDYSNIYLESENKLLKFTLNNEIKITMNLIGRMGNQLFMSFMLLNLHFDKGYKLFFNSSTEYFNNILYELNNLIQYHNISNYFNYYENYNSTYNEIKINTNTIFNGYFQSYKYFDHNKEKIINYLKINEMRNKYQSYDAIALHIRKGDYQSLTDYFILLDINYYKNCINYLINELKTDNLIINIFSESKHEINDILNLLYKLFPTIKFTYINGGSAVNDLFIMSKHKHNIIANSSFSWWSAYLNDNENKIVCYPSKYYCGNLSHISTIDMYPDSWKEIDIN